MTDKITLDRETFKVLAADTRVDILKSLSNHKKTLTDLAQELGMSPSTVKEHLDKLVLVGLIYADDKGMKWKYYKLTEKGRNIVNPVETKVWILLGTTLLMLLGSSLSLFGKLSGLASFQAPKAAVSPLTASTGVALERAAGAVNESVVSTTSTTLSSVGESAGLMLNSALPASADKSERLLSAAGGAVNESARKLGESFTSSTVVERTVEGAFRTTSTVVEALNKVAQAPSTTLAQKAFDYGGGAVPVVQVPYLELSVFLVSAVLFGICVGYILKKRRVIQ